MTGSQVTDGDLQAALRAWGRQRDLVAQCQANWQPTFDAQAAVIHEQQGNQANGASSARALESLQDGNAHKFAEALVELDRLVGVYQYLKRRFDAGG